MTSLKRDKVCPQCEHRKLWHVEQVQLPQADFSNIGRGIRNRPALLPISAEGSWRGVHTAGQFEAFICAQCGWTEWYATGLEELKENPSAGLYFVDAEPKAGLR